MEQIRSWIELCENDPERCRSNCQDEEDSEYDLEPEQDFGKVSGVGAVFEKPGPHEARSPLPEETENNGGATSASPSIKNSTPSPFAPSRLLDLEPPLTSGYRGDGLDRDIVLVDMSNEEASMPFLKISGKYATLSYCWGEPEKALTTTPETMQQHMASISFSELPSCLQDAVQVARKLKIRYLWIDALCIVQGDDGADFNKESALMFKIYNSAFVTIAAAWSTSSDTSFLKTRKLNSVELSFQLSIHADISGTFCVSLAPECVPVRAEDHVFDADHESSTWNTRGWVWQEQVMSSRILIFGERMTHLRCPNRTYSEDCTKVIGATTWYTNHCVDVWRHCIIELNKRKLSRLTDKLSALSNLANMLYETAKADERAFLYLAGNWYDQSWRQNLCWTISPLLSYEQSVRRLSDIEDGTEPFAAPNWSWASREEEVDVRSGSWRQGSPPNEFECEMIEHHIKTMRDHSTGRVLPGSHLCLRGKVSKEPPLLSAIQHRDEGSVYQWDATLGAYGPMTFSLDWVLRVEDGRAQNMEGIRMLIFQISGVGGPHLDGLFVRPAQEEGAFNKVGAFSLGVDEGGRISRVGAWPRVNLKLF